MIEDNFDDLSHSDLPLRMSDYNKLIEQIQKKLSKFNLTVNQSKIYVFLGKQGPKTAPEVCKKLRILRTETYHVLAELQSKGIVFATFGHPMRFSAIPVKKTIHTLIDIEREKLKILENNENEIIKIWNNIPEFVNDYEGENESKFQVLVGINQINRKIKHMLNEAKKEILIIGSEQDFGRFYHSDLLDELSHLDCNVKIITGCSQKTRHIIANINQNCVKKMPDSIKENICFIIKDKEEVLFFTKNGNYKSQDLVSMWTNSNLLVYSMQILFRCVWSMSRDGLASEQFTEKVLQKLHESKEVMNDKQDPKILIVHAIEKGLLEIGNPDLKMI